MNSNEDFEVGGWVRLYPYGRLHRCHPRSMYLEVSPSLTTEESDQSCGIMLRIIECMESKYDVKPFAGYTFDQILHLLQKNEAQTLIDPDTGEKGVYLATPRQQPGVKKIASMTPSRDRQRTVTYGCD